jgi:hypothetical protein
MPHRLVDGTTVNVIKNGLVGRANAAHNTCRWRNVVMQERAKVLHKKYVEVVEQELTSLCSSRDAVNLICLSEELPEIFFHCLSPSACPAK